MVCLVRDSRFAVALPTSHHQGNSGGLAVEIAKEAQRRSADKPEDTVHDDSEAAETAQPGAA